MNFLEIKNNKKFKKNYRIFFDFINFNISDSIFKLFGFNFFLDFLKINQSKSFYIERNKRIIGYISYIDSFSEKKLKNLIIKFIIRKPFFLLLIVLRNLNFFFKFHKPPTNYLQLLHLIINLNDCENNFLRKKIHLKIDSLNKKVCKLNKFKGIYAMYHRKNNRAANYYKKNNYILYNKNFFFYFVKKEIR
jgi:hypothetical protein